MTHKSKRYRLLIGGTRNPHYKDELVLQECTPDEIGDDRWTTLVKARSEDETMYLLLELLMGAP